MATLDDKLLGEKTHYYCGSSEEEEDYDDAAGAPPSHCPPPAPPPQRSARGVSSQTGPKGVIGDWSRYKQLQAEQREEQKAEMEALVKKISITCRSSLEDEDERRREAQVEEEISSLMIDDEFLQEFIQKRMSEMMAKSSQSGRRFHAVQQLGSSEEMLKAIDDEHKSVTVVIHVYDDRVSSCSLMNDALNHLSRQYSSVKFCKIESNVAGLSRNFTSKGLPALLVYKEGALVGNFVRLEDDLCDDFCPGDVENFLIEHGLLEDRSCLPLMCTAPLTT